MRRRLWGLLALALALATFVGCSGSSTAPSSDSHAGSWSGTISGFPTNVIGGACLGQSCATVSFTVNKNNTVTCFMGGGLGIGGCNPDVPSLSTGTGDPVQGNQFQLTGFPPSYAGNGVFDSFQSAHGTLTVPIGTDGRGSNGTRYNWTASKRN